jgi:predicted ArsR family transcriptional regulator
MDRIDRTSTRNQILRTLKTNDGSTIMELAEQVGVSPVTVRHHLNSLQADNLVRSSTGKRNSVGRPYHVFHLTEAADELFPRQYLGLTRRLLDQIKTTLDPETVSTLFEEIADEILSDYRSRLEGKSKEERIQLLSEILENEGFLVTWKENNGGYTLVEHSCPYRNLGREHPDICKLDHTLITQVLDSPVKQTSCLLHGDQSCVYTIG